MGVQITGIAEMQAKLNQLAEKVRDELMVKAVREAGQVIARGMRERAPERVQLTPKSDAIPRGALRRDIRVKTKLDAPGFVTATIGPSHYAYVARWVEYGHRMVRGGYSHADGKGGWRGGGKAIGEVPEHPFLRPAFEATQQQAMEQFRATMQAGLQEVIR